MIRLEEDYSRRAGDYDWTRYLSPKASFSAACEVSLLRHAILRYASGRRLLVDVACGTGFFTHQLSDLFDRAVGLDLTPAMLHQARTRTRASARAPWLIQASADDLPVATDSADVVVSTRFLHLFPQQHHPRIIENLLRIVRPGGLLVVEHDWMYGILRRRNKKFWSSYHPSEMPSTKATRLARIGVSAPGLPSLALAAPRVARWLAGRCVGAPLNRLATFVIVVYQKRGR